MNQQLPLWDLKPVYPSPDSEPYKNDRRIFLEKLKGFHQDLKENPGKPADSRTLLLDLLKLHDELLDRYEELSSYLYCLFSTDTGNSAWLKELNSLESDGVEFRSAGTEFRNWLASLEKSGVLSPLLDESEFTDYRFFINQELLYQKHQMSPAEEDLASRLGRSGADAWGRLQEAVSSQISAVWDEKTGEKKTVIQLRALAFDPDREVRKRAFEKELSLWKQMEIPLAYALNGIKGTSLTLCEKRGYGSPLEVSLDKARIGRKTHEALIGVMTDNLPLFQKYLRAKARCLGREKLAFYDIFAPVGEVTDTWTLDKSRDFIVDKFSSFSPPMGIFAQKAFDKNWIDARPREGKVGGAYCTSFPLSRESRILCNFDGSFDALSTIAHELGHAYHHEILKDAGASVRQYPMTLAETASIFAENVVFNQAYLETPREDRLSLLDNFLVNSTQLIVDILSRFLFESRVFESRKAGELSPGEFCDLMTGAQKDTYGQVLEEENLHPYMWAVKGHYYFAELDFYNFPYAFGQLFGLGLYGLYEKKGAAFVSDYEKILFMTGRARAEEVTASSGFDITSRGFWQNGIDTIARHVEDFSKLVDEKVRK